MRASVDDCCRCKPESRPWCQAWVSSQSRLFHFATRAVGYISTELLEVIDCMQYSVAIAILRIVLWTHGTGSNCLAELMTAVEPDLNCPVRSWTPRDHCHFACQFRCAGRRCRRRSSILALLRNHCGIESHWHSAVSIAPSRIQLRIRSETVCCSCF